MKFDILKESIFKGASEQELTDRRSKQFIDKQIKYDNAKKKFDELFGNKVIAVPDKIVIKVLPTLATYGIGKFSSLDSTINEFEKRPVDIDSIDDYLKMLNFVLNIFPELKKFGFSNISSSNVPDNFMCTDRYDSESDSYTKNQYTPKFIQYNIISQEFVDSNEQSLAIVKTAIEVNKIKPILDKLNSVQQKIKDANISNKNTKYRINITVPNIYISNPAISTQTLDLIDINDPDLIEKLKTTIGGAK